MNLKDKIANRHFLHINEGCPLSGKGLKAVLLMIMISKALEQSNSCGQVFWPHHQVNITEMPEFRMAIQACSDISTFQDHHSNISFCDSFENTLDFPAIP